MCYNTSGFLGKIDTWTNRIFYDKFSDLTWKGSFAVDTWNNSQFCCSDPLVSPTYNVIDNVISSDVLSMRVTPTKGERIVGYSSSISSYRDDILYGSFRMSMKMTPLEGTSFGFFFFYSISEEIDLEILGHEQDEGKIRTSIQPIIRDSSNRASNLSQKVISLNRSLSSDFIEYRFDWFKSRVDFFVENRYYYSLTVNVPTHHGKIVVNHRTNGNPKWSRGPPVNVSDIEIKWIDVYFNSSDSQECRSVNYGQRITNIESNELRKYIPSIVVVCLVVVIIGIAVYVNVYRKIYPSKAPNVVVEEMRITERRP